MAVQKLCQACGKPNREQARFCGYCGKPFQKMKDCTTTTSPALHTSTPSTARAPTPQDFGITPTDISRVEARDAQVEELWPKVKIFTIASAAIFWLSYGLLKFGWTTLFPKGLLSFRGLVVSGFLSFALFVLARLTAFVVSPLGRVIINLTIKSPLNAKTVYRYKEALREFQEWWLRTQHEHWCSLSGRQFELELAMRLQSLGWNAVPTPASGDGGIDIDANREGKRMIVQCKAHRKPVGPAVARELYGTMLSTQADSAMLASVSGFTKGVYDFCAEKPIHLADLNWIIEQQKKLNSSWLTKTDETWKRANGTDRVTKSEVPPASRRYET
jgi:HJR/Mrr/RecB family endonuclease